MSHTEAKRGTLVPTFQTTVEFLEDRKFDGELGEYCEHFDCDVVVSDGMVWEVVEVEDLEPENFCVVRPGVGDELEFVCSYYNGGASLCEVLETGITGRN